MKMKYCAEDSRRVRITEDEHGLLHLWVEAPRGKRPPIVTQLALPEETGQALKKLIAEGLATLEKHL